jgi:tRNA (guanine-N7-)-methyltransferase
MMAQRREALRAEVAAIPGIHGPIVWEVGCGHGHFLAGYAEAHKELPCIGVDIKLERVDRGERKRARAGLGHLHFLQAEASLFLEVLPEATRLASVFVLFPDPWPKKRHHKNRILQSDFMSALARRAEPGATFQFRTDHQPYFEDASAMVAGHPAWALRTDVPWPFELPTVFQQRAASFQSLIAVRR